MARSLADELRGLRPSRREGPRCGRWTSGVALMLIGCPHIPTAMDPADPIFHVPVDPLPRDLVQLSVLVNYSNLGADLSLYRPIPQEHLCIFGEGDGPLPFHVSAPFAGEAYAALDKKEAYCTGLLIDEDTVLTSAHCYREGMTRIILGYYYRSEHVPQCICGVLPSSPVGADAAEGDLIAKSVVGCDSPNGCAYDASEEPAEYGKPRIDIALLTLQDVVTSADVPASAFARLPLPRAACQAEPSGGLDSIQMPRAMRARYVDSSEIDFNGTFGSLGGTSGSPVIDAKGTIFAVIAEGQHDAIPHKSHPDPCNEQPCVAWLPGDAHVVLADVRALDTSCK